MCEADGAPPQALVVDDDPGLCLLMHAALENNDPPVAGAGNGTAALDLFERLRPNIVTLDVMIPE